MDPSRLDPKRSTTTQTVRAGGGTRPTGPVVVPTATNDAAGDAAIVSTTGRALDAARSETRRLDESRVAELSERVRDGTYKVDPEALADRIIDDALGPEQPG